MNRVTIIGRLGRDPQIRTLQSGDKVANLRVATSERWKDKESGEKKEATEWHSVAVFGGAAKFCEYLSKGALVAIEGQLQTRKWQDQSGADRFTTEIVVRVMKGSIESLEKAEKGERSAREEPASERHDLDDEIPF